MLMTAQQAQSGGMICPMMSRPTATAWCNGPQCPVWRTVRPTHANDEPAPNVPARGYCGLAGKPEES